MGIVFAGVWFILWAVNEFAWAKVPSVLLGIFAFAAGVLLLIEGWPMVSKIVVRK